MTRKSIILSILAAILLVVYLTFFTDWFGTRTIQIMASVRPNRPSSVPRWDANQVTPVAFKLDRKYSLTSLKVVEAADWATNEYAVALWHLVSDKGSMPVETIVYGEPVKGMEPKLAELAPQPLAANVNYVLLLEAGSTKGHTNFFPRGVK